MKFNLEVAVTEWRRKMRSRPGIEPGHLLEIEENLRDRIDDYVGQGMPEKEAFDKAVGKTLADPDELSDEFFLAGRARQKISRQAQFIAMAPNYMKLVLRNFIRRPVFTAIHVLGLIVGLSCTGIIGLYLHHELTYDRFIESADRIYRLGMNFRDQQYSLLPFDHYMESSAREQSAQAEAIANLPGVEAAGQFYMDTDPVYLRNNDRRITSEASLYTNTPSGFHNIFQLDFLAGAPENFVREREAVLLTDRIADQLFQEVDDYSELIGRAILIRERAFVVQGVVRDLPDNSHLSFDLVARVDRLETWGARTYVKLTEGTEMSNTERALNDQIGAIIPSLERDELFGGLYMLPLTSIHLTDDQLYELRTAGNTRLLWAFGLVGLVVLLVTLTNYANLAVAMNAHRDREIGMRKVLGARSRQISVQFLFESLVLAVLIFPLVLLIIDLILPSFGNILGVDIQNLFFQQWSFALLALTITFMICLLAGIYPAWFLSSKPIGKLFSKSSFISPDTSFPVRKVLIAVQLAMLIGLISTTILVHSQLEHLQNGDPGFQAEGVMYVSNVPLDDIPAFRSALATVPGIEKTGVGNPLVNEPFNQLTWKIEGGNTIFNDSYTLYMDYDALETYGITGVRDSVLFTDYPENAFLINQSAAEKISRTEDVPMEDLVGRTLIMEPEFEREDGSFGVPVTIDGIFRDIHLFSFRYSVESYFIQLSKTQTWVSNIVVRYDPRSTGEVMAAVEELYERLDAEEPVLIEFQEELLRERYSSEESLQFLTRSLSILTVALALIGLLAFTAFLTGLKQKEIGIRKVLGAGYSDLVRRFTSEYFVLTGIGMLAGGLASFYLVGEWLGEYAYRIDITPWPFLGAGLLVLVMIILMVGLVTLHASRRNPAEVIRSDQ